MNPWNSIHHLVLVPHLVLSKTPGKCLKTTNMLKTTHPWYSDEGKRAQRWRWENSINDSKYTTALEFTEQEGHFSSLGLFYMQVHPWGWRKSTAGKAPALHIADLSLIPSFPYGIRSPPEVTLNESRDKKNPWSWPGVVQKQKPKCISTELFS